MLVFTMSCSSAMSVLTVSARYVGVGLIENGGFQLPFLAESPCFVAGAVQKMTEALSSQEGVATSLGEDYDKLEGVRI
jgi:hypothetical protein